MELVLISIYDTVVINKTKKETEVNMIKGVKIGKYVYVDSTTIDKRNLDGYSRGNKGLNTLKCGDVERGGYTR